jgi:alkylhydroperoxidase family enzyme
MQPRLAPLEPPYEPEVADTLARMMPPGIPPIALFRVLAHNPRILERIKGGGLLDRGAIGLREREIVILRTTARLGSEYEWGVHVAFFAAKAGFATEQIAATTAARPEPWSDAERLLIELVDSLVDRADIADALWQRAIAQWSIPQLLEIVVLVGFYHTISFVTRAFRVPLEPEAPRFPAA